MREHETGFKVMFVHRSDSGGARRFATPVESLARLEPPYPPFLCGFIFVFSAISAISAFNVAATIP
jgi:hypothetical protein